MVGVRRLLCSRRPTTLRSRALRFHAARSWYAARRPYRHTRSRVPNLVRRVARIPSGRRLFETSDRYRCCPDRSGRPYSVSPCREFLLLPHCPRQWECDSLGRSLHPRAWIPWRQWVSVVPGSRAHRRRGYDKTARGPSTSCFRSHRRQRERVDLRRMIAVSGGGCADTHDVASGCCDMPIRCTMHTSPRQ
jgi:hypothetical protein